MDLIIGDIKMAINQNEIDFFAKLLFGEAASEGGGNLELKRDSMVAIANTIRNRSNISGQSMMTEATKPAQYTAYSLQTYWRELNKWIKSPGNKKAYQVAREVAMDLVDGRLKDTTGGATFYYNPKIVKEPFYTKGKKPIGQFGEHVFYKNIDPYSETKTQPKLQPKPLESVKPLKGVQPQKSLATVASTEPTIAAAPKPKIEVGKTSPEKERMFEMLEKVQRRAQLSGGLSDRVGKALKSWLGVLPKKELKKARDYLGEDFPK